MYAIPELYTCNIAGVSISCCLSNDFIIAFARNLNHVCTIPSQCIEDDQVYDERAFMFSTVAFSSCKNPSLACSLLSKAHISSPFSSSLETFPSKAVCALCRNKIDVAATCLWNYKGRRVKIVVLLNIIHSLQLSIPCEHHHKQFQWQSQEDSHEIG